MLKKNPAAAIQETFGLEIPPELKIQVIEETAAQRYLVLPQKIEMPTGDELNDRELEAVSAGQSKESQNRQAQRNLESMFSAEVWGDWRSWVGLILGG